MEKTMSKNINPLQDIWKKKIEGTKNTFEKDKAFIQQKSNSNETKTNEENKYETKRQPHKRGKRRYT